MIILAIDPGYDKVGFAIMEEPKEKNRARVIFSECFSTNKDEPFYNRIWAVGKREQELIGKYKPKVLVVESLFFSKNTKTALKISEIKGIMLFIGLENELEIREFTPNQIKVAVSGYGKATKKDIKIVLEKVFSIDTDGKLDDELDAIAVGITHFAFNRDLVDYNEN